MCFLYLFSLSVSQILHPNLNIIALLNEDNRNDGQYESN